MREAGAALSGAPKALARLQEIAAADIDIRCGRRKGRPGARTVI
jgi:hypothetical protein